MEMAFFSFSFRAESVPGDPAQSYAVGYGQPASVATEMLEVGQSPHNSISCISFFFLKSHQGNLSAEMPK